MLRRWLILLVFLILSSVGIGSAQIPWNLPAQETPYSSVDFANPVNWNAGLNRGLVAWFIEIPQLNAVGNVWRDITRRQSSAILTNTATPGTVTSGRGLTTRLGGAGEIRLDGVNDTVAVPNLGPLNIGNTSFALHLCFKVSSTGVLQTLLRRDNFLGTGIRTLVIVDLLATGVLRFYLQDASAVADDNTGTVSYTDGLWHDVWVERVLGSTSRVWIDGQLSKSIASTTGDLGVAGNTAADQWYVGSWQGGSFFATGAVDDLRWIIGRGLTPQESQASYGEGRTSYPTTLNRLSFIGKAPGTPATNPSQFFRFFTSQGPVSEPKRTLLRALGK